MIRVLTDEGARQIANMEKSPAQPATRPTQYPSNAAWWWAVVTANSRVYTRRIVLAAEPHAEARESETPAVVATGDGMADEAAPDELAVGEEIFRRELAGIEGVDDGEADDEAGAGDEPDVDGVVAAESADDEDVGREGGGRDQHERDAATVVRGASSG